VQPRILLDVGLQLSVSATLGIVLLWPRLRQRLRGLPRPVGEPIGLTLAVTLATSPVMLSTFHAVSLVSPVAHVAAVPLLSAVLLSTALLALVSPVAPLGMMAGWLAWLPSTLLAAVIQFFGGLPAAALSTGRLPPLAAAGLSTMLLAWGVWGLPELGGLRLACSRQRSALGGRGAPATCIATLVGVCAVLGVARPDGRLHVDRLALERGEAIFIRGPTGRTVLVANGRVDAHVLIEQVADRLAVWEHKLHTVVALDARAERALALTLAQYPADQVVGPGADMRVDLGGGRWLDVSAADGRVSLNHATTRSGPTPSAARPGSGD
jgi:competence protein ComEC